MFVWLMGSIPNYEKDNFKDSIIIDKKDFLGLRRKATNCKQMLPIHAKSMKFGRFKVQDHQNKSSLVPSNFCNFF